MPPVLLLDAGNTRLKYSLYQDAQLDPLQALDYADASPLAVFQSLLLQYPSHVPVFIVQVLGEAFAQAVQAWCKQQQRQLHLIETQAEAYGVTIAYDNPKHYGADRFVGIVAAHQYRPDKICMLIDCGTAVTIDVVDQSGMHLGGAIFSGVRLCRQSLLQGTGGLSHASIDASNAVDMSTLATDTSTAIRNGCVQALVGAIKQWHDLMESRFGDELLCVLCGGDAENLSGFLSDKFLTRESILLEGVAYIARQELDLK